MVFIISDSYSKGFVRNLQPRVKSFPSNEQALEAAKRQADLILAVSRSGNTFQIFANKHYEDLPAASIRSREDVDDALAFAVRLFEISASMNKDKALALLEYIGEKT